MSSGLSLLNYSHLSTKSSHAPIQSNYALPTSTLPDYISSRLFPVTPKPMYSQPTARRLFTQRELDMVLYGYAPDRSIFGACPVRHALSGVFSTTGVSRLSPNTCHISSQPMKQEECFPSTLDLPRGLGIFHSSTVNHKGVFCTEAVISKGTKFGPFKGRVVHMSEVKAFDDNSHMWEVFNQRGSLSHFVDGKGAAGGWMTYVNCARYPTEQNMVVHQVGQDIYYEACKDITPGMELLVWYGDAYQQFIGIPLTMKENSSTAGNVGEEKTTDACQDGYQCDRCGKMFAYAYYRDKHLKYTRCVDKGDRKFKCHLCDRSFEKRDRLRIHILHVHEKHRPHKCTVCDKCFSQSSSLNKHMRVHSGERPYKCVYCSKAFTASSILRTHIRQHSGEKPFKCKHCGKAFASHAAHDSHVRRTHNKNTVFGKEILNNKVMPVTQPLSPSVKSEGSSSGYSDTISECAEDMHIDVVA